MGLFGAIVVIPTTVQTGCVGLGGRLGGGEEVPPVGQRLRPSGDCYDREYLFQFSEIDPRIHTQAEAQVKAIAACPAGGTNGITGQPCPAAKLFVATEPYRPAYFLINGRSMPDDMDADYAPNYPAQPYNGNPHMHPLDQVLLRTIGQGRWEHPFHEHANHVRILARDGNLILAQNTVGTETTARLAGLMMFTTDTFPGQSFDGIFYWSGKGLNWDIYGHTGSTGAASATCTPDANGYYTNAVGAAPPTFDAGHKLCQRREKTMVSGAPITITPLEAAPVGQVAAGGPATLPDPLVATNGLWYNGTPYLGPDAVVRSRGPTPLPVGGALQNPLPESGIASCGTRITSARSHRQRLSGRHADDDAGRSAGLVHRRNTVRARSRTCV